MRSHIEWLEHAEAARSRKRWREAGAAYLEAAQAAPDPVIAASWLKEACAMHDLAQASEREALRATLRAAIVDQRR